VIVASVSIIDPDLQDDPHAKSTHQGISPTSLEHGLWVDFGVARRDQLSGNSADPNPKTGFVL
jgi:hypothetical protein